MYVFTYASEAELSSAVFKKKDTYMNSGLYEIYGIIV